MAELARVSLSGARVVWEFHLNEALTDLYVGLHRELRGERLNAARFIQSYAVDRVIALLVDLSSRTRFEGC